MTNLPASTKDKFDIFLRWQKLLESARFCEMLGQVQVTQLLQIKAELSHSATWQLLLHVMPTAPTWYK